MNKSSIKKQKRERRHSRIRAKAKGTAELPRLAVFRSNRSIYVQLINDDAGVTLAASDSRAVDGKGLKERARAVGVDIATKAKNEGIARAVFDRGGFLYAGSVREVAEGAREGGLKF
jgi:large subunit ribosomal protein L18